MIRAPEKVRAPRRRLAARVRWVDVPDALGGPVEDADDALAGGSMEVDGHSTLHMAAHYTHLSAEQRRKRIDSLPTLGPAADAVEHR